MPPERLEGLMEKHGVYESFRLLGIRIGNSGMDLRQTAGAFLIFQIDRVLGELQRRFQDPGLGDGPRGKLLNDFGPALLALDEALQRPIARKAELDALRKQLGGQVTEAEADAELADACLKLRQDLVLPRQDLFAAARRYLDQQQAAEQPPAAPAGHGHGHGHPYKPTQTPGQTAGPLDPGPAPGRARRLIG